MNLSPRRVIGSQARIHIRLPRGPFLQAYEESSLLSCLEISLEIDVSFLGLLAAIRQSERVPRPPRHELSPSPSDESLWEVWCGPAVCGSSSYRTRARNHGRVRGG